MSMIGCFYALKDEDLEAIVKAPKRIHRLWSKPPPPKEPSFLGRLFGAQKQSPADQDQWEPSDKPTAFDVDKAWQGIHFLLTGSDWEGDGPLAFILHGGREIPEDLGYGSPHGFTSSEVRVIDAALRDVEASALYERADLSKFTEQEIYPQIWATEPKEQCIGYVTEYFKELKKFVAESAQSGRALIAYIG
ncbi:MAG: YfbM family protein [Verrucomicrobia bacterium]|nr:YfbM family protein [Verrucomicrobiota bacterium]